MHAVQAAEYPALICQLIHKAKKRVTLMAMAIQWGPEMDAVYSALFAANKRGVKVRLILDPYSLHPAGYDFQLYKMSMRIRAHKTQMNIDALVAAGAEVSFTSPVSLNPFKGRCHLKAAIIDDVAFSFGGVNFRDEAFSAHDYMLRTNDARMVEYLESLATQVARRELADDSQWEWHDTETVVVDGGEPGRSAIYQKACDIVRHARKVTYVSQMCPSGELAKLLQQTDYKAYFNRPTKAPFPVNISVWIDQKRSGIKNSYKGNKYIHAKLIIADMPDGSTAVLTGSHNFSWRGVAYGTQEIALCSNDAALAKELQNFVQTLSS